MSGADFTEVGASLDGASGWGDDPSITIQDIYRRLHTMFMAPGSPPNHSLFGPHIWVWVWVEGIRMANSTLVHGTIVFPLFHLQLPYLLHRLRRNASERHR
jgi:hypothetical protein